MKEKRVIMCGGGTGGHIYPALAIGRKLKERDSSLSLTFVGTSRAVEKNILERQGLEYIPLKIKGLKGKGLKSLVSLAILPFSFIRSLAILLRIKPSLVIGVGGYSSGPVVLLASWLKIPTLILEQNVYPGLTNRLLIPWIKKAVVSFKDSLAYFKGKGIFIGNPVREEFYSIPPKETDDKLTVLIFGGSQGSHFLNKGIVDSLDLLKEKKGKLRIFHQTGERDYEWVKNSYANHNINNVEVAPFFFNMADYFKKSDIIICRAGATTIAELIASQKASLLVPFSKASDNHQVLNARELEKIGGAEVLLEEEFNPETFTRKIFSYLTDKKKIKYMEKMLSSLKKTGVSDKIADLCFELMDNKLQEEAG